MIVLIGEDSALVHDTHAILTGAGSPIVVGGSWESLSRDARAHATLCVCAFRDFTREARRTIQGIRNVAPALPLVLITSGSWENARRTAPVKLDDLIWIEDTEADLLSAITDVTVRTSTVERFAQIIEERARGIDLRVREALTAVCHSAPPVPAVGELAKMAIMCERKLRVELRLLFGGRPRVASGFLTWVLVLSAYDLGRRGVKPARLAEYLAVDESTLVREVKRLAGCTLAEFLKAAPRLVLRRGLEDMRLVLPPQAEVLPTLPPAPFTRRAQPRARPSPQSAPL